MRLLLLLFFVGYAAASFDVFDEIENELVDEILNVAPKRNVAYSDDGDEEKSELEKKLRESFEKILERIKDAIEHGKIVKQDLLDKYNEIKEKLKDHKIDLGEKIKALREKVKEHLKDYLRKILEKLGLKEDDEARSDVARLDLNIKGIFKQLKKALLEKIDKEALKTKIEELFGKGNEMADQLMKMFKEKGEHHKSKLMDWLDRVLGDDDDEVDKRSLGDMWEKVKEYFNKLKIDLKEKYMKFGEWVKEVAQKHLDETKSKIDNVRQIAREFIEHSKSLSKEVAAEGLDFLRQYQDDLKELWQQVKDSAKEVISKKD